MEQTMSEENTESEMREKIDPRVDNAHWSDVLVQVLPYFRHSPSAQFTLFAGTSRRFCFPFTASHSAIVPANSTDASDEQ